MVLQGTRNRIEATAAHLLPYDPVAKKRSSGQKRNSTQISPVMETSNPTSKKMSVGKTGVHLHYYRAAEYRALSQEQKDELREWRANKPNISRAGPNSAKKEASKKPKSSMKMQVASLDEAELNKAVRFEYQNNDEEKYIMSVVEAAVTKTLNQQSEQNSRPNLNFPSNLSSRML